MRVSPHAQSKIWASHPLWTAQVFTIFTITAVSNIPSCEGQLAPISSGATCPAVRACYADSQCTECLRSLAPFSGTGITFNPSIAGPQQVHFYKKLVLVCSSTDLNILLPALHEVTKSTPGFAACQPLTGFAVARCQAASVQCFVNSTCRACLTSIYNLEEDRGLVLDHPTCANTDQELLRLVAAGTTADAGAQGDGWCYDFPRCSFNKNQCKTSDCATCLRDLRRGDVSVASAIEPCESGTARRDLDSVMSSCTVSNLGGEYWRTRCKMLDICRNCLQDMGDLPLTMDGVLEGYRRNTCHHAFQNDSAVAMLKNMVYYAPQNYAYDCAVAVLYCLAQDPLCEHCLYGTANASQLSTCNTILNASNYIVTESCLPCPESVFTINKIVVATTVVGSVSMAACILVVLTILAHGHDRISIRFRIIIGLMLANALYSCANAMPLDQLDTSKLHCGQLHMTFETIRFGRSLWLFGKYSLVCFEVFVLGASIWALQPENGALSARCEASFHVLSLLGGLVAFIGFYVRCDEINRSKYNSGVEEQALSFDYSHLNIDDNMDDESNHNEAVVRFTDGRIEYDELEQRMLQAWIGMLGVAIIMWVMLRLAYNRVISQWRKLLSETARAEMEDEWIETRRSAWKLQASMLQLQRDAYDAVARPLEPYVAVFMLFAVPAIVMSTDWCQRNSGANTSAGSISISSFSYGTCDAWCEFALAWRSFATVVVFTASRERRTEMLNFPKTLRLLYGRIIGGCSRSRHREESIELAPMLNGKERQSTVNWQIEASEVSFGEKLADGSYGVVWKGQWSRRPEAVAIKVLKALAVDEDGDILDEWALEDFRKECMMLQQLEHPNLLKFHGYGQMDDGRGFLVTELCGAGSLRAVLADNTVQLTWATRISIARDLATGLAHLHSIPIVHRDLKSDNCLLTDQDGVLTAKVADFGGSQVFRPSKPSVVYSAFTGIARRVDNLGLADLGKADHSLTVGIEGANGKMTTGVGTLLWMAPEMLRGDQKYGRSVDVYSFGVILWELATREEVWNELNATSYMNEVSLVTEALKTGRRPTIPEDVNAKQPLFVTLMRKCWAGDPIDRPEFGEVKAVLERCVVAVSTSSEPVESSSESSSLTRPLLQNAW